MWVVFTVIEMKKNILKLYVCGVWISNVMHLLLIWHYVKWWMNDLTAPVWWPYVWVITVTWTDHMSKWQSPFPILIGKSYLGREGKMQNGAEAHLQICRVEISELQIHFLVCSFDVNLLRSVFRTQFNV